MAFKRMKPARPAASAPIEAQLFAELRKAVALKERGRLGEAREIAQTLQRRYPSRKEPLLLSMDLAIQEKNPAAFEEALEPLMKLAPDDPEIALAHARAAASNGLVALSLERFKRFLVRWPHHKEAPELRNVVPELEQELGRIQDEAAFAIQTVSSWPQGTTKFNL